MSSSKETRLRLALADAALSVHLGVKQTPPVTDAELQRRVGVQYLAAQELLAVMREMDKRLAPVVPMTRKNPKPRANTCDRCGTPVDKGYRTCHDCVDAKNHL